MTMSIYAVHADGGAPINESALCAEHLSGEFQDHAYAAAESAEDRPELIEFRQVEHPEFNDTVCIECGTLEGGDA